MDIPVNAEVQCTDGPCGRSKYVIINPVTEAVTHIVVAESGLTSSQRLVPVSMITDSTPHLIRLKCTKKALSKMQSFIGYEYIQGDRPWMDYPTDEYLMSPMVVPVDEPRLISRKAIPQGELAVNRGARVMATDGNVGHVDEFLVESNKGHITHLILRKGHLWDQREVTIPVSEIDHITKGVVHLKLSTEEVGTLPAIPVRRRWL